MWSTEIKLVLKKMGKLAFNLLQRNSHVFLEEDLRECELNFLEAAVFSGMCTELPPASPGGRRRFCYVHATLQVKQHPYQTRSLMLQGSGRLLRYQAWPDVCFPPGVHGCFVRLRGVLLGVEERSGVWIPAHVHVHGSDQVGLDPAPKCAGANPQRPAGTLRHVLALLVRLAFSTLPRQAARRAPFPPWCSSTGQRAGWGGEAAAADHPDSTPKQHRQAGELKGMLTRDDAARWVSNGDHSHSGIYHVLFQIYSPRINKIFDLS